ncbi:MAG: hypothetical protein KAG12_03265 [Desulfuromusa sp.]|nr:hypothetical protein [Desulfuromusa sp.]
MRNVMQNLPVELSREYQRYSFAGLINGRIDFSGRLNSGIDLLKSAQLNLSDVRANSKNLRAGVSGDIRYSDKTLQSENLRLQYGDLKANLQIKAEKFPDDLYHGDFILTADTLDLNKMLTASGTSGKKIARNSQGQPEIEQKTPVGDIGPFDIPVDMVGTMAINRVLYKKLNIDKITADLSLKNNYLSIQNFSSKIGTGGLKGSSSVNLGVKGLAYQGQTTLSQPNVATLVAGLIPETSQSVTGLLHWQNSFSGKGTISEDLLQVLQLKGEFSLQNGEAKGSPLFEGLASFLGSSDLKILSFQSMLGQYNLYDGLTRLSGQLDSSKTKLTPSGTVDLAGRLNLQLDARFAPEVLEKLGVSKSLKQIVSDQDGWGILPLQIKGTLSHPKIDYDSTALQNQILEKAKEKASQKLLDKLVPDGGETEPIQQLLDNTLNKLFGK